MPVRLVPLGAAAVMAALISGVLAQDTHPPSAAATAPIPNPAPASQPAPAPQAAAPAAPTTAPEAKLSREQLEQLLAPVALYPDQLLGQILMASTYPAEVVEAARWVRVPAHRRLKGDALAAALKPKGWDPSVMALVPFPRVLEMMSERLDWLRDLGTAFVAQQADVMVAVQHLRHLAMAAGTLKTTPQCHCVVSTKGETITIATVASEPVCVPAYNTRIVYGTWPYPAYPPVYFPVPVGVAFLPGFYIGFYPPIDVAWYWPLWGWDTIDWGAGSIIVDPGRYAVLAAGDPGFAGSTWAHDAGRWGAVDAGRMGAGAAAAAGMAAALPGMRGAAAARAAALGGRGAAGAAAAAGLSPGRGGPHGAQAFAGRAAAMHAARGVGGARWGGHAGHASYAHGGGHFARTGHFAAHGGGHWGGHFAAHRGGHFGGGGGPHFAMGRMHGGGHFGGGGGHFGGGGGPHFAMGGGGGGHGGGGGGHGGGGGGHGGGGGGHGH